MNTILIWGLLASLPLVINLRAYALDRERFVDAVGLSAMVLIMWAMTNALDWRYPFPDNKFLHPMFDLAGGMTAMAAWWTHRKPWKLILAGLFLLQSVFDASFWLSWLLHKNPAIGYNYVLWLNVVFIAQLVVLGWSGGASVARDLFARLSLRPDLVHMPGTRHGRTP
jgi:hypothetical protein